MRIRAIVVATLLAFALMGCSDFKAWSYEADPRVDRVPLLAKRVVVTPLDDLRLYENRNLGVFLACFVPLMPYGTVTINRPELMPVWKARGVRPFKPTDDVAKAIAEELDNSGIFSQVVFSRYPKDEDLVLLGDLMVLKDDRWITLYGLTYFFGDFLWIMGAPMGGTANELTLKLTLVERETEKVLWSQTFSECDREMEWLYSMKLALRHPRLLKMEMRQAVKSLEATLSK